MKRRTRRRCAAAVAALLACAVGAGAATVEGGWQGDGWQGKVDPGVLAAARSGGTVEALVVLRQQAELSGARALAGKEAKGRFVFETLSRLAAETQAPLLAELRARGVEHRPYWIANMVWVRGDLAALRAAAARADVARVAANPWVAAQLPSAGPEGGCPQGGVEESLTHVGAPGFWSAGFDGAGVVVAGADTGVEWTHPALRNSYRGWNGSAADHAYHWHDAIHAGGGSCGANAAAPCDDHDHGTHTMGTMVGDDGAARLGMAPGARWIACRNMDQGNGSPASYSECFQFFVAPTDLAGQNPDPSRAPHVINNSWSCPPSEGCTDPEVLRTVVENTRAAGIAVVTSAGNTGPSCTSVSRPPGIYDASFTVGAADVADEIALFSSRGPVAVDGSFRLKPDVTAPGVDVCSSVRGNGYALSDGTSMASPHTAGLIALLISARSCLAGDVDALEAHVRTTAEPATTPQTCGGVPGTDVPNNTYGHGTIRAVLPDAELCTSIFGDGFESGTHAAWSLAVP